MSKGDDSLIDLDEYKLQLVKSLVIEINRLISAEEKANGSEFAESVAMSLLASSIAAIVLKALIPSATTTQDETRRNNQTCDKYVKVKRAIEDAIAHGFTGGFAAFYGDERYPDFLCQVTPIDDGSDSGVTN